MKHEHKRRCTLDFDWPDKPFNIALVEPEIPPNTGAIARLCAATGTCLHLVGPLGFRLTDAAVKRAGLDYWDNVKIERYTSLSDFDRDTEPARKIYFSTSGTLNYMDIDYSPGDFLVFGNETRGLSSELLEANRGNVAAIPIMPDKVRSLNLAMSASIVLYEAMRQARDS